MAVRTTREVFDRAKQLALAKDLTGFADLFADDGVHELPFAPPGVPRRIQGRDALREYFGAISSTPLTHDEFRDLTVYETTDPGVIVAEYDAHGRVTDSGREYLVRYIQVIRVREGRITLWRDYWNPLASAELLGRIPQLLSHFNGAHDV